MFNLFSKREKKEGNTTIENIYTKEMYGLLNQLGNEALEKLTQFITNLDYNTTGKLLEKLEKEHKYLEAIPIIHIAQKKFRGDDSLAYISAKILSHLIDNTKEQQNLTTDNQANNTIMSKL